MVAGLLRLEATFFRTSSGNEPVREWLWTLSREDRKAVGTDIDVWEVRSNLKGRIARVLFAVDRKEMVLLHGFIKKSQRTPAAELELAETRWREWCRG